MRYVPAEKVRTMRELVPPPPSSSVATVLPAASRTRRNVSNAGELKLIISHGESVPQPLTCYRPAPNTHHWLRVLPQTMSFDIIES